MASMRSQLRGGSRGGGGDNYSSDALHSLAHALAVDDDSSGPEEIEFRYEINV